ncbi:hypothetical protein E2C01_068020 [Portunus trituberculatus]|uniref:Uncharacterized protein n=1 Tax=Portunus trituberculatus TaxID=210409 RepID=A0A5B7HYZ3_PORTR|nr:hypothetical protein [Portunus trituberculatus]
MGSVAAARLAGSIKLSSTQGIRDEDLSLRQMSKVKIQSSELGRRGKDNVQPQAVRFRVHLEQHSRQQREFKD